MGLTMDGPDDVLDLGEITTSPNLQCEVRKDGTIWARVNEGPWHLTPHRAGEEILEAVIRYPVTRVCFAFVFGRPVTYTTREG